MAIKYLNPPVGISHVTEKIEDIYRPKLAFGDRLIFHPAAQPNSFPHFGTLTTIFCSFALAKRLQDTIGVAPEILFWELENAPAKIFQKFGKEYYIALCNSTESGLSLSEKYLQEFRRIYRLLSDLSGIPYVRWSYTEFQSVPRVRRIVLSIIEQQEFLAPLLCPSEQLFKVRFACPKCHLAEKRGGLLEAIEPDGSRIYRNTCPEHGIYFSVLSEYSTDVFDVNTPVRALAREAYLIEQANSGATRNMMSDGADWAHYAQVNIEALHHLGYSFTSMPMRFFAPVIMDEFGAKLAKSAQIGSDAYRHLPRYFVDSTVLEDTFGPSIYERLWDETRLWLSDPKRVFRNYTVTYMRNVLNTSDATGEIN